MTKRRAKPEPHPKPEQLEVQVQAIIRDALALVNPYRRCYEQGLEPARIGEPVPVLGGDESDVPYAVLVSRRADGMRRLARSVAKHVRDAEVAIGNARVELQRHVEPGYRQPPRDKSKGVVTEDEWRQVLEKAAARRAKGEE